MRALMARPFFVFCCALFSAGLCIMSIIPPSSAQASSAQTAAPLSAYQFNFEAIEGGELPLSAYNGEVLLIVNTASRCGFTPQYDGLQMLYDRYREQGFTVIGVPSDDFGKQELAQDADIKAFCEVNFNIDFPLTTKTVVKGNHAHPFYQWALTETGNMAKPRWNFHKYLIDRNGQIVDWFSSVTSPQSPKITQAVEKALAQAKP